jgi:hypothetical protein
MTTTLPVPVRFALPGEEWAPVDPEPLGVTNAAFLAVRRGAPGDYTPSITVSGDYRNDGSSLEQIGDESVLKLQQEGAADVELLKRRLVESEHAPGLTQSLGALVSVEGRTYDVRQAQAIWALVDVHDETRRVVVVFTLSCTFAQWEPMVREFQQFMASVEVVPEEGDQPK